LKSQACDAQEIDASVRADIGGDEQRVSSISTAYSTIFFLTFTAGWIALPIPGKVYHVVVNAPP